MQPSIPDAERRVRAAVAAFQGGRAAEARDYLKPIVDGGMANIQVWMLLAHAQRALKDWDGLERAVDQVLALDADSVRALVLKGDARDALDDVRGAVGFYKRAGRLADLADAVRMPADLSAEVARGLARVRALVDGLRVRLDRRLAEAGVGATARSSRFEQSLGILAGEKQLFLQQPTTYYFPELSQVQFFEPKAFDWADVVERQTDAIRAELEAALSRGDPFSPYLQSTTNRPSFDFHGLLDNPAWSTLHLWKDGAATLHAQERFPNTFAALRDVPMPHITRRAPAIFFSLLQPGARIDAHTGVVNTRLICHLPLKVPPGCGFRVGNEVREWEVGKLLIFDDSMEHEAWNNSAEDRVVLIFDVWRPELTLGEREAVAALFEAIDGT